MAMFNGDVSHYQRVYEILQYTGKTMCEISMVKPWIQIYPVLQDPKVGPHAWLKLHLVSENVFLSFQTGKVTSNHRGWWFFPMNFRPNPPSMPSTMWQWSSSQIWWGDSLSPSILWWRKPALLNWNFRILNWRDHIRGGPSSWTLSWCKQVQFHYGFCWWYIYSWWSL